MTDTASQHTGRRTGKAPASAPWALVDAHVHLYRCFAQADFFDRALANFQRAAAALGLAPGGVGCLMFTESASDDYFRQLAETQSIGDRRWHIAPTAEHVALLAGRDGPAELLLVAGRQVVTAEGLEVLALGTRARFDDGEPVGQVLAAVEAAGALAVLPWGFGKWTGRRGALAHHLAQDVASLPRLCFGDSAGRAAGWPRPKLLALAERCGRLVLPGTDPLPIASDIGKVGRFGFVVDAPLDLDRPFAALARWLGARRASPATYGRLEWPLTFAWNQAAMQLRKRLARTG